MLKKGQKPLSVTVTWVLVVVNSLLWLGFGVIIAADLHPSLPLPPELNAVFAALCIGIAVFLLAAAFFLHKHSKIAYYLLLIFFALTSIVTVFDDFGLSDLIFVVINLIPLLLLIKDRGWYMQAKPFDKENI